MTLTNLLLWLVACAFLFEDNFPENTLYNKCINVCAGVFLFFFGNYLLNSMSSDLVVYQNPPVITSYQEALDWINSGHKLEILIPPQIPESDIFKNKPSNSIEGKLFKYRSTTHGWWSETNQVTILTSRSIHQSWIGRNYFEMISLEVPLSMHLT